MMLRETDSHGQDDAQGSGATMVTVEVSTTTVPDQKGAPKAQRRKKPLLVADLFCGAGGSSTGARKALKKLGHEILLTCVNHWPVAIETHKKNHPDARHYCQDVSALRPLAAVPEGYLDLLMASPTCTHHSRARGGRPTSDQQRMDPWHVITWLTELRVRCLLIENVPEFIEWGPVDKRTGRPLKSRKGEYFQQWLATLKGLGFKVEWRIINCADFGDATTRVRFFLMARSDGKRLPWPEPTHTKDGGADLFGQRQRWRAARQVIDWERKGNSIFGRKRPLAPKTVARIMAGAKKFGWPEPFLVILRQHMDGSSVDKPLPSICAGGTHIGVAEQVAQPIVCANLTNNVPQDINGPVPSIVTSGNLWVAEPTAAELNPFVLNRAGEGYGETRAHSVDDPTPTATTRGAGYLVEGELTSFVLGQQSGSVPRDTTEPLMTIAGGGAISLTQPMLISLTGGDKPKPAKSVDETLGTITTKNGVGMAEASLVKMKGKSDAASIEDPAPTIATKSQLGLAEAFVFPVNQGNDRMKGHRSVDRPLPTILTRESLGIAQPLISPYYGSGSGETCKSVEVPLDTVTAKARFGVVEPVAEPFVISPRHGKEGAGPAPRSAEAPLPTITAGGSQMGVVEAVAEPFMVHTDNTSAKSSYARSLDRPLYTITTSQRQGVVEAVAEPFLVPQFGERPDQAPRTHSVDEPIPTVTSHGAGAVVEPCLITVAHGEWPDAGSASRRTHSIDDPVPGITASSRQVGVVEPVLVMMTDQQSNQSAVRSVDEPTFTAVTKQNQAVVEPLLQLIADDAALREAAAQGRLVLIDGKPHLLDIRFRMLEPYELARAMGFSDEESEYEFVGTKTEVTKQIGNAVPVNTACSLVAALFSV